MRADYTFMDDDTLTVAFKAHMEASDAGGGRIVR
tara:strand:+ start:261 stop:362 length:102 start_codon:yes stop_codon:yes gene_type:complete